MLNRKPYMALLKRLALIFLADASSNRACVCALSLPSSPAAGNGKKYRIAVIGGGSSGMFATASIVDALRDHDESSTLSDIIDVKVYESTREVLRTIRISHQDGILHDTSKTPRELINAGYPRGRKEVTALLTKQFPPMKQQRWYEDRGVKFKIEQDGALVSVDNKFDGVISAIMQGGLNELIQTEAKITSISKDYQNGEFQLTINGNQVEQCDCVVLATGNSHLGHQLATTLGHTIAKPARSCFALKLEDTPHISNLEYGSRYLLPHVRLSFKAKVKGQKRPRIFKSEGPARLEVCNNGIILSGKAPLSLSSMACFELQDAKYTGSLLVHFCPDYLGGKVEFLEEYLWQYRQDNPHEVVGEHCPIMHQYVDYDEYDWETESFKTITNECIPSDLWHSLTQTCGAPLGSPWSKMSPKKVRKLAESIVGCPFEFNGKTAEGDFPYINAGGIILNEIDMSTMKSKTVDGLYCCGQILDGDASHNSFSLMRDFAMGKVAGENAVLNVLQSLDDTP